MLLSRVNELCGSSSTSVAACTEILGRTSPMDSPRDASTVAVEAARNGHRRLRQMHDGNETTPKDTQQHRYHLHFSKTTTTMRSSDANDGGGGDPRTV